MDLLGKGKPRRRTHAGRYGEILSILLKYGFSEFVKRAGLIGKFQFLTSLIPEKEHVKITQFNIWEKVRFVLEELGPTFIKFGQIASNRRDMFPNELVDELEKLQDAVPPFPFHEVKNIIQEDFGKPLEEVFQSFSKTPTASASIAQVHRAVLYSGEAVAVKVRRPNIENIITADIDIMYRLASIIERYGSEFPTLSPTELVEEFEKQIWKEVDLYHELLNIKKFKDTIRKNKYIYSPGIYKEYSTKRVLTLEFIEGRKLGEVIRDNSGAYDKALIADRGADVLLKQIFIDGFFHADPHPGNMMVLPGDRLCFLDFGMMGSIPRNQQNAINSMLLGMVRRDSLMITGAVMKLTDARLHVKQDVLEQAIYEYMDEYLELPLEDIDFSQSVNDLIELIVQFHIKVPTNLTLVAKTLMIIEGVGRAMNPQFKTIEKIEAFSAELFLKKFNPERMGNEFLVSMEEYGDLIRNLPVHINYLFNQAREHKLRFPIEHQGLDPVRETIDKVGSRLVFGFVLSALLISSALIVQAGVGPEWRGMSIFGVIGFALGGVMGGILLISSVIRFIWWRIKKIKSHLDTW